MNIFAQKSILQLYTQSASGKIVQSEDQRAPPDGQARLQSYVGNKTAFEGLRRTVRTSSGSNRCS